MKRAEGREFGYKLIECEVITREKNVNIFINKNDTFAEAIVKLIVG